MISLREQIDYIKREIALREKGVRGESAQKEIEIMRQVLSTLEGLVQPAYSPRNLYVEIRGVGPDGQYFTVRKILGEVPKVKNDALVLSFVREAAVEFCEGWGK